MIETIFMWVGVISSILAFFIVFIYIFEKAANRFIKNLGGVKIIAKVYRELKLKETQKTLDESD